MIYISDIKQQRGGFVKGAAGNRKVILMNMDSNGIF